MRKKSAVRKNVGKAQASKSAKAPGITFGDEYHWETVREYRRRLISAEEDFGDALDRGEDPDFQEKELAEQWRRYGLLGSRSV